MKGEEYYEYDEYDEDEYEVYEGSSEEEEENSAEDNSVKLKELLLEHQAEHPADQPDISADEQPNQTEESDKKSAKPTEQNGAKKQANIKASQAMEARSEGCMIHSRHFISLTSLIILCRQLM